MSMSRNAGLQICSMMMLPQLPFVAVAITLSSKVTFLLFLSRGAASLAPELVLHFYCFCDVGLDLRPNS